ncbi:hypothetical protein [Pseudorhodoferax sp. Leaf267]|uniref:nSTAND1 domain-containing NTPase n=1 Tax=Pseudorhodoferax sp. Leaf267 TaxID=1736316 RepID=UPI0006FE1463|nr:hypothetical protein [Pseudorhodoferax sp. Leaf267]KQP22577.1 hypothetical protein ASF43_01260 [Pseudorhodoferax sp. Leaf267]
MTAQIQSADAGPVLTEQRPWPGLAPYDEASRSYFKGREQESRQLAELVEAHAVVSLYGKSGLGKSSLLQAGSFPLLRARGFLPVHARLDFAAPGSPWDQLLRLLLDAAATAGLECPDPAPGEGLWQFLHRPDFELWTADNHLVTPVLVIDQFEEVFSRTAGHGASAAVFDGLGDLVENRIPSAIASDKAALAALDAIRCRYRIVLSFREDYLPDLRAWEPRLPSLLRQSMRLLPMARAQALDAVARAGHAVLAEGAAEAVVDFVASAPAGGGEATVEPVMLSLCCTQLNRRRGPGQQIDAELLRTAGPNIIEDFYEEAMHGLPDAVRQFIEDHLVQGRSRGSYARDDAIAQGFIDAAQLDQLTSVHRLLRVDPAGNVPRIELIHDRVVEVVRRARDTRRARQQADAARRAEDAQAEQAREQEALARQRRAKRWIATALAVVSVLAVVAVYSALLANRARQGAVQARESSDAARQQAERSASELAAALDRAREAEAKASAEAAAARQRLQEVTLLVRYGWTGETKAWLIDNAVQADAAIQSLLQAGGAAGRERRRSTTLEIWTKDADQDKVRNALSELGFGVRTRPALLPDATNAVWFGTPVPVDDAKLVALALMRSGIQVRAILPLQTYLPSHTTPLVQAGAYRDAGVCPPYKVADVMATQAFERKASLCAR